MTSSLINNENYDNNEDIKEEKVVYRSGDSYATKNILLYKNGDIYSPAKRIVVNKKYIRNWESLLEELTKNLNPHNGAVRDIRTPFHGTRIKSLDDLIHNGKYVAVSKGETLKIIDYMKTINVNSPPQQPKYTPQKLKPLKSSNGEVEKIESRIAQQLYVKSSIIYVFRNGDPFTRAIKVIVKPHEQKHMSILVRAIEERVLLPSNKPIRRLFTLNGNLVKYAKDIEDGHYYVAASHEPFEDIKYGQLLPVIKTGRVPSKRNQIKYLNYTLSIKEDERTHRKESDESPNRSQRSLENATVKSKTKSTTNQQHHKNMSKPLSEKEMAAVKIQAAFRGFYTRKEIARAKENNEEINVKKIVQKQNKIKKEERKPVEKQQNVESKPQATNVSNRNKPKEVKIYEKHEINKRKKSQDNLKEKETRNKDKAAIIIQSNFRGYKVRKEFENKKVPERKSEKPENKPERKHENKPEKKPEKKPDDKFKEKAAVIIQANYRGYKTRKNMNKRTAEVISKKQDDNSENKENIKDYDKAAITIQTGFRSYKVRKSFVDKHNAAIKIQAGYRGYKTRKHLRYQSNEKPIQQTRAEKASENEPDREHAAIIIQASFKGYKTRRQMNEKHKAACRIQASFRGFRTRKEIQEKQKAATLIQASFRGYRTRSNINEKKKAATVIQANFRGFKTRREIKNKSAQQIQAGFRGYQTRKGNETFQQNDVKRNNAAAIIQAGFRGYLFRRDQQ